jgi:hypothetical protein
MCDHVIFYIPCFDTAQPFSLLDNANYGSSKGFKAQELSD